MQTGHPRSYEQAVDAHEWRVPERYNIAVDVCDKHPDSKPAMVFEDFRGDRREVTWGEQRSLANRAANVLTAHGVERGDRVAICAPASPETAAMFLGTWKAGAILLSLSVLYGDDGIRHRVSDSEPKLIVTDADERGADAGGSRRGGDRARPRAAGGRRRSLRDRRHIERGPGPDLLHVRHHGPREGDPSCPPLHPRARGVHLLPPGRGR